MKLAAGLASCVLALTATSAVAGALDDLSIGTGGKECRSEGQAGGAQVTITNANRWRSVLAVVSVDADRPSYAYREANGHAAVFTYPYEEARWLAPGASAVLGCEQVRFGADPSKQTFALAAGAYQDAPAATAENASRFVGAIEVARPARCTPSNPGLFIMNRHPSRTIVAKVAMGGGVIGPMFLPPQGTGPWLGCRHDRPPGAVTVVDAQFTTAER